MTAMGTIIGTAAYMAPEQARGQDRRSPRGHLGVRRRAVRDAGGRPAIHRRRRVHNARERDQRRRQLERAADGSATFGAAAAPPLPGKGAAQAPERDWRRAPRARRRRRDRERRRDAARPRRDRQRHGSGRPSPARSSPPGSPPSCGRRRAPRCQPLPPCAWPCCRRWASRCTRSTRAARRRHEAAARARQSSRQPHLG